MSDHKIPADQLDATIERLQGHGGWRLRHIPSRGYWIELEPDAVSARGVIEAKA